MGECCLLKVVCRGPILEGRFIQKQAGRRVESQPFNVCLSPVCGSPRLSLSPCCIFSSSLFVCLFVALYLCLSDSLAASISQATCLLLLLLCHSFSLSPLLSSLSSRSLCFLARALSLFLSHTQRERVSPVQQF